MWPTNSARQLPSIFTFYLHDLRLIVEHTHHTRLLDETNTATVLGGSVVTSQGALGTSDVTIMASHFSPHSVGHFLRRNSLLPMDANPWILSMLFLPVKC